MALFFQNAKSFEIGKRMEAVALFKTVAGESVSDFARRFDSRSKNSDDT